MSWVLYFFFFFFSFQSEDMEVADFVAIFITGR